MHLTLWPHREKMTAIPVAHLRGLQAPCLLSQDLGEEKTFTLQVSAFSKGFSCLELVFILLVQNPIPLYPKTKKKEKR